MRPKPTTPNPNTKPSTPKLTCKNTKPYTHTPNRVLVVKAPESPYQALQNPSNHPVLVIKAPALNPCKTLLVTIKAPPSRLLASCRKHLKGRSVDGSHGTKNPGSRSGRSAGFQFRGQGSGCKVEGLGVLVELHSSPELGGAQESGIAQVARFCCERNLSNANPKSL